jgi:hypothetical protein
MKRTNARLADREFADRHRAHRQGAGRKCANENGLFRKLGAGCRVEVGPNISAM